MRRIELKSVKIDLKEITGEDVVLDFVYKEQLSHCLNNIPEKGLTIEDIEKRLKIREKLRVATDSIVLDDKDYDYLKGVVLAEKWRVVSPEIVAYIDSIRNAKEE